MKLLHFKLLEIQSVYVIFVQMHPSGDDKLSGLVGETQTTIYSTYHPIILNIFSLVS